MGDILRDTQSRKRSIIGSVVGQISRNGAYNLDAVRRGGVNHRTATDTINRHTVYEVAVSESGAYTPREKAQSLGGHARETEPADFRANGQVPISWEQWYKILW